MFTASKKLQIGEIGDSWEAGGFVSVPVADCFFGFYIPRTQSGREQPFKIKIVHRQRRIQYMLPLGAYREGVEQLGEDRQEVCDTCNTGLLQLSRLPNLQQPGPQNWDTPFG